jgi:hypothetical protein
MLHRGSLPAFVFVVFAPIFATAAAPTPKPAQSPGAPAPYATFVEGATVQNGLIPIVTKDGEVYLALSKSQLGQDFIETSIPSTGLGGFGPAAGEPYVAPARILHFERFGDKIVVRWPNTFALVQPQTPEALGARESLPASVIAVTPIVAEDDSTVVISAAPFLGDVADYEAQFEEENASPMHGYHLDTTRAYFEETKAFPENDILRVSQTWASADPNEIDNVPDARSVEVDMSYNIIAAPHDGYMPRIADPRVGYFEQALLDFSSDRHYTRNLYYVSRWNFAPQRPGVPSRATNPIVYYLSNDIPMAYRDTIRNALLGWNQVFAKVGILDAIEVRQQPADPSWNPDDIRHNMVRWIDTSQPQYGAEALLVNDPRTGEEINVGINIDAEEGMSNRWYHYVIAPVRGLPDTPALEAAFHRDYLRSIVMHESGHDMGLQHNFIGSEAYTAKELQSKSFTEQHGIASSVMEYTLINLWPKGTPNGTYNQDAFGPYDYHAIDYGYRYIRASTPEQELPELRQVAALWNRPQFRFESDEDVQFRTGHAIDPRVAQDDLTDHPLAWCSVQEPMMHSLMDSVLRRFPPQGESYDDARRAFTLPMNVYLLCATLPAHSIGGEYLSRNDPGDPGGAAPLQAVPRAEEARAWHLLGTWLFSDAAWDFSPDVLRHLTYSEVSSLNSSGTWVYKPPDRHDYPIVETAERYQQQVLDELFAPLTLQRIDDLATKYRARTTMSLVDLFDWSRASIFGDIAGGAVAKDGVVRRNLQIDYAKRLASMWNSPAKGTPSDAQALARLQLELLERDANGALGRSGLDEMTQAHLEALLAIARQALEARATIAP